MTAEDIFTHPVRFLVLLGVGLAPPRIHLYGDFGKVVSTKYKTIMPHRLKKGLRYNLNQRNITLMRRGGGYAYLT
jgi:hypothetical protein